VIYGDVVMLVTQIIKYGNSMFIPGSSTCALAEMKVSRLGAFCNDIFENHRGHRGWWRCSRALGGRGPPGIEAIGVGGGAPEH